MIVNLPKVFIIGGVHTGISWLGQLFNTRKELFLCQEKGLNYFANDDLYRSGIGFYYKQFLHAQDFQIKVEVAPNYLLYSQKVIQRIKMLYGNDAKNLKFILYLHAPLNRMIDEYLQNVEHGIEDHNIAEAFYREQKLLENSNYTRGGNTIGLYLNNSLYAKNVENWLNAFTSNQFYIVTDAEIKQNKDKHSKEIFHFLGLDYNPEYSQKRSDRMHSGNPFSGILAANKVFSFLKNGNNPSQLNKQIFIPNHVKETLYSDIEKLSLLTSKPLNEWKDALLQKV